MDTMTVFRKVVLKDLTVTFVRKMPCESVSVTLSIMVPIIRRKTFRSTIATGRESIRSSGCMAVPSKESVRV